MLGLVKIIIVIVVILVICGYGIIRFLRRKLTGAEEEPIGKSNSPFRIHLKEDTDPQWIEQEAVKKMVDRLVRSGFFRGKAYTIEEVPASRLLSLVHPKSGISCVILENDEFGECVEFCILYKNGDELGASNSVYSGSLDRRPGVETISLPGAGLDELVDALKKKIEPKPRIVVNDNNFQKIYEESYYKNAKWRNERGGITTEELKRTVERLGHELDPEELNNLKYINKMQEIHQWHDECLDEFQKNSGMSSEEFQNLEKSGKFMIFYDNLDPEAFLEYMHECADFSDEQTELIAEQALRANTIRLLFDVVAQNLIPDIKARKLGSVQDPFEADIYLILNEFKRGKTGKKKKDTDRLPETSLKEKTFTLEAKVVLDRAELPAVKDLSKSMKTHFRKGPKISKFKIENGIMVFNIPRGSGAVSLIPHPMPEEVIASAVDDAIYWPEAGQAVKDHSAHLIVTLNLNGCDYLHGNLALTHITAVAADVADASAIYWSGCELLYEPQQFLEIVVETAKMKARSPVWINFRVRPDDDGTHTLHSYGLYAFDLMEIEIVRSKFKPEEMREFSLLVASYLIDNGPVIKNGDTFGPDEETKIKVTHEPSVLDPTRKVYRVTL